MIDLRSLGTLQVNGIASLRLANYSVFSSVFAAQAA